MSAPAVMPDGALRAAVLDLLSLPDQPPRTAQELFQLIDWADSPKQIRDLLWRLSKNGLVVAGPPRPVGATGGRPAGRGAKPTKTYRLAPAQGTAPALGDESSKCIADLGRPLAECTLPVSRRADDPIVTRLHALAARPTWPDGAMHAARLRALADLPALAAESEIGCWLYNLADRLADAASPEASV